MAGGFQLRRRRNHFSNMRMEGDNNIFHGLIAGPPTNGAAGTEATYWGPGSTLFDVTNNILYLQVGTLAVPYWQPIGGANAGQVYTFRRRNSIAEVNAGVTLLAAVAGIKFRLVNAFAISIGGSAAAVTTVDILGTQAAGAAKLVAFAQASLTQSTRLMAGNAGAAIIADGASFVDNDVNTPITLGKTGAALTTSVSIDTEISVAFDA